MSQFTNRSLPSRGSLVIVALIFSAVFAALPLGVFAAPGDLYVTNLASNTIDVYSPDGVKSTFASGLNSPQDLVFDQTGNLYVADGGSGNIFKYDTAGNQTTFFTGLAAPMGLAIDGNKLLVAESGLDRLITLALDQSAPPTVFITRDDPILDVAVGGDTRYVTYDATLNSEAPREGVFYFFNADTQGVAVHRVAPGKFDVYVTTEIGEIWLIKPYHHLSRRLVASGLSDPHGIAFLPGGLGGGDGGELYVADRGAGEIFKYTSDGTQLVFVSDAGIPNFLAFEIE